MTTYPPGTELVVPIELSHNKIHLAIGGIQIPSHDASTIVGGNGDMAENDTASFDTIFFFHHAFIDRMFWAWQTHHKETEFLKMGRNMRTIWAPTLLMRRDPRPVCREIRGCRWRVRWNYSLVQIRKQC